MPAIEVSNLVKQYKGAKSPSIDNISFNVDKGEFFAFLGPNGAGKITTISILTTHYIDEAEDVDKVCIINKGKIVSSRSPDEMKQSLLRKALIFDADDRDQFSRELSDLGLTYIIEDHIVVSFRGQNFIQW